MQNKINKLIYYYQQSMFYANVAVGELRKPGVLINESIMVSTLLAVKGLDIGIATIAVAYILIMSAATVFGRIIIKRKVMALNNTFNNRENNELQEIIQNVKEIKQILQQK